MNDRKTIIVWMDGKKTKVSKGKNADNQIQPSYIEHAATNETNEDDPIPTYVREHSIEEENVLKNSRGKRKKFKTYKHIFMAIISAVLIGIGLGVFMLNMFTNIDVNTDAVSGKVNLPSDSAKDSPGEGNGTAAEMSTYSLKGFHAYVLQAGLFNENSNVTVVQEQFEQAGFPTMVWKRDKQFYLFAGLAQTKDQADSIKSTYKDLGLETYTKEWSVKETEVEMTESEHKWLQDFQTIWITTLENLSSHQTVSSQEWNSWIESYPDHGEYTRQFYDGIKKLEPNSGEMSQSEAAIMLLKLLSSYENLILN